MPELVTFPNSLLEQLAVDEVRRHFGMLEDSPVTTFLLEHPALSSILLDAVAPLRKCFGADCLFNLRAPFDESGSQTLYAVAMWPGSTQGVRTAFAAFDDTWWVAHSQPASGYLVFTYELV